MNGSDSNGALRSSHLNNEKTIQSSEKDQSPTSHLNADEEQGMNQYIPVINELEVIHEKDLSFAAIFKGTAANPLTTFERKAALINVLVLRLLSRGRVIIIDELIVGLSELDKFGMGKYQICIWFLCGFGYFLDLAWAQGVGLGNTAM